MNAFANDGGKGLRKFCEKNLEHSGCV